LLEQLTFQRYLNASKIGIHPKPVNDFFETEPKIGIGRGNATNISDNGLLYRSVQKRPKEISFLIDIEGVINAETKKGYLQLGGEKKVAFWEEVEPIVIDCPLIDSTCFKIYLSTPAFFKDGWKPTNFLTQHGLKLLTAAIGRPLQLGGWDVEGKKPKPMWQAVPAGSVYYVEASSKEKASELAQLIHGQSISENIDLKFNLKQQGFGIAYIGRI
jgi:CRISPR-associated protein Cmr3